MAVISIEVDTSKKSSMVKVDGKKINDVSSVFIALGDFFNIEISQIEELDENTSRVTRIVANKEEDYPPSKWKRLSKKKKKGKASEEFPGMFVYEEEISDFTTGDLS